MWRRRFIQLNTVTEHHRKEFHSMHAQSSGDEQVFSVVAEAGINSQGNILDVETIVAKAEAQGLTRELVLRSLHFLEESRLIILGGGESYARLAEMGIERWARANLDYEALQDQLGKAIVATNGRTSSRTLGQEIAAPDIVIRHIIRTWGNTNQLKVGRPLMGGGEVLPVTGMAETFRRQYANEDTTD
jgi:hypothetical protein